jgi:hypothetical protein
MNKFLYANCILDEDFDEDFQSYNVNETNYYCAVPFTKLHDSFNCHIVIIN